MTKEAEMLEKIRNLLGLSIKDFTVQMNWPNTKYYGYIKNGRKLNGKLLLTHPTISKVFNGINYGINNFELWDKNKEAIKNIVILGLREIKSSTKAPTR